MFIAAKRRHTIAHGVSREFLLSFHDDDPTRLYLRRRAGGLSAQRGNVKVWCGVVVPKVRTFLCWKVASRAWIRETRAEAVQNCDDTAFPEIPDSMLLEARGIRTSNVVPSLEVLTTWIDPPWASAIQRPIDKPSPAPPASRDRALSAR